MVPKIEIVRYGEDTYPTKGVLSISSVPTRLVGWSVELRYLNIATKEIRVVDCIVVDEQNGKIDIFPHDRGIADVPLLYSDFVSLSYAESLGTPEISNQCWMQKGEYQYSIIRKKLFGLYEEVMTHQTGVIKILDRI